MKFFEHLGKTFRLIFGREDADLSKAKRQIDGAWERLSSPKLLPGDVFSIFPYENKAIKSAVIAIKRRCDRDIASSLGKVAGEELLSFISDVYLPGEITSPLFIAIPMAKKDEQNKGFNHAEVIAEYISQNYADAGSNGEFVKGALEKIRRTQAQKHLKRSERLTNVKNSMAVKESFREKLHGRNIIVVDDVTTTGATLLEARRALKAVGAKKIILLSLAH